MRVIGATTIPVWHEHVKTLPFHFAASGMGSAAAMLTLLGHDDPALNRISVGAAVVETVLGASIELIFNRSAKSMPYRVVAPKYKICESSLEYSVI